MDSDELFNKLRHLIGGHKHKVVKTYKPTEEEALEYMALKGFEENAKKAAGVHQSKAKLFWSKVELRTGEVTRAMNWNEEKSVIEVVVCDHSGNPQVDQGGDTSQSWES